MAHAHHEAAQRAADIALIAQARPELDAELLAHILLGALHSDLVVHLVRRGETDRMATTVYELVSSPDDPMTEV